jgi:hypothetical protein
MECQGPPGLNEISRSYLLRSNQVDASTRYVSECGHSGELLEIIIRASVPIASRSFYCLLIPLLSMHCTSWCFHQSQASPNEELPSAQCPAASAASPTPILPRLCGQLTPSEHFPSLQTPRVTDSRQSPPTHRVLLLSWINNRALKGLEQGFEPKSGLVLVKIYVESTRSMNPQGCAYLSVSIICTGPL